MPSDYLLVHAGKTEFAEVKSSGDKTAFRFSLLRKTQSSAARMILAAGGDYNVYAQRLPSGTWFRFPYGVVLKVQELGRASIPWIDLEEYKWTLPSPT